MRITHGSSCSRTHGREGEFLVVSLRLLPPIDPKLDSKSRKMYRINTGRDNPARNMGSRTNQPDERTEGYEASNLPSTLPPAFRTSPSPRKEAPKRRRVDNRPDASSTHAPAQRNPFKTPLSKHGEHPSLVTMRNHSQLTRKRQREGLAAIPAPRAFGNVQRAMAPRRRCHQHRVHGRAPRTSVVRCRH